MSETCRLLLLEDDSFVADILKLMLNKSGFTCDMVETQERAISMYLSAQSTGLSYSAIILDLILGNDRLGGLRTLKRIKEIRPDVKSILCSGFTQSPVVKNYQQFGFDSCLQMPFSSKILVNAISGLLNLDMEH